MTSLRERIAAARPGEAVVQAPQESRALADLARASGLGPARAALAGRAVLLRTRSQLGAVQGMVELDGLARRLVVCPPDLAEEHLPHVFATAGIDAVVTDTPAGLVAGVPVHVLESPSLPVEAASESHPVATEWLLFTSGTTGVPKMVIHSLAGLTGAIPPPAAAPRVWATFYDIRRYGGLQALLRALTGGCAMGLCDAHEAVADQLARLGGMGVTHLTGTPSHWRRVLMSSHAGAISPAYVRLSGEIADQALLDALKAAFPRSTIVHAYASTEAGVGFEVDDGLEGFPEAYVGRPGPVELKVVDGSLRVRSPRMASGYAGPGVSALAESDGFVDTGDMLELRDGRWRFVGRRSGVINVGGLKVHPEEVEATLNRHPAVRMSRVFARKNPILGAVVSAEVALVDPDGAQAKDGAALRESILEHCRSALPPHKAPATIRFVPQLQMTAGGKLERAHG
jgi:acyl-coenzyme A synthetase/AMP-(fatty) acid ligase